MTGTRRPMKAALIAGNAAAAILFTALLRKTANLAVSLSVGNRLVGGEKNTAIASLTLCAAGWISLSLWLSYAGYYSQRRSSYLIFIIAAAVSIFFVIEKNQQSIMNDYLSNIRYSGGGVYTYKPGIVINRTFKTPSGNSRFDYNINADGNRFCPYETKRYGLSIALVGDSFIFGELLNTPDILCSALGGELEKRGAPARVVSLGMQGLALPSFTKIANQYLNDNSPELIVMSYISGNDFEPFDRFTRFNLFRTSHLFRVAVSFFGKDTVDNAMYIYGDRFYHNPDLPRQMEREADALNALSKRARMILISYYGEDRFTQIVRTRAPGVKIITHDWRMNPETIARKLVIQYDGHPTGEANRELAKEIADMILNKANH